MKNQLEELRLEHSKEKENADKKMAEVLDAHVLARKKLHKYKEKK